MFFLFCFDSRFPFSKSNYCKQHFIEDIWSRSTLVQTLTLFYFIFNWFHCKLLWSLEINKWCFFKNLTDSNTARPSDSSTVENEIRQADCAVIVFSFDNPESFNKIRWIILILWTIDFEYSQFKFKLDFLFTPNSQLIRSFWLPEIRRIRKELSNEDDHVKLLTTLNSY